MYIMLNYIIVQTRLRHKTGIVTAFEQMDQFVDDDVFQAFRRFFLRVPDSTICRQFRYCNCPIKRQAFALIFGLQVSFIVRTAPSLTASLNL